MKKIVLTGPESCGKTMLAKQLALHYNTLYLKEVARDFLNNRTQQYLEKDLRTIGEMHIAKEDDISTNFNQNFIFIDTDLITIKIWSFEKYGRCSQWIIDKIRERHYDLYLLCKPDIPWVYDSLREHPTDRARIFKLYESNLYQHNKKFKIVEGIGEKRLENAINIVNKELDL